MSKDNICWVCGTKEQITRHHAIPTKMEPLYNLTVPLCLECHIRLNDFYIRQYGPYPKSKMNTESNATYKQRLKKWYAKDVTRMSEQLTYAQKRMKELEELNKNARVS